MSGNLWGLFVQGGWIMWPLLIFSILSWTVIFERVVFFLTFRPKLNHVAESLMQSMRSGDVSAARQICHTQKPEVGELFLGAIDTKKSRDLSERTVERSRLRLMGYMKKNLWILGTIGSASPFVGLLGTVVGIVRAFHDMAEKGAGGFSVVAAGISEALIATAAGLIVAIVALITYNIFITAANQTISGMKITLDELIDLAHDKSEPVHS
ncbi:MAG: MotA/TolQ/ExbB proton channel family protein [Proteobacteria bacterium]|nr:MotA/TolQ/ExbB proton channel family protein [Pseudomonadota bacterium]NDC23534.1 MotA/TolQ/ExbB proton channel family protein [Pseudomonadota bacterium]NDD04559.1 MotA/TolQ/ExbB proton channel family protein [Pseudomonadota bacterium]NDG28100.1 MotA/TolQ/ExbB proton channel family protein [Pseudomonadota bacterium]